MAVMWPRSLPGEIRSSDLRAAERKVYERLAAVLDDSWTVFYSRPWIGLKPNGEEIDGECDFVIARADSGFLALEVKGGGVSYEPKTDAWMSVDRWGFRHNIKNPVAQARTSKHQLLKKLQGSKLWAPHRIRVRHGVILPDSARPNYQLGADMPLGIFCFLDEFEGKFGAWIEARLGRSDVGDGEAPLGQAGILALEDILAKPFRLRVPLGHLVTEDDRAIQLLTPQQFHILSALEEVPRAAITGAAGTGKTILAMEKARRCADAGMKTLIVCYNAPLADHIARELGPRSGVDVSTFHRLCRQSAVAAGLMIPSQGPEEWLLADVYPELLMQAVHARRDLQYQAVIVDEAQDFRLHWWAAVDSVVESRPDARLYVFLDNNQKLYGSAAGLPQEISVVPIRLTYNLRNTVRIHDAAQAHYEGPRIDPLGPEGTPVEWIKAEPQDWRSVAGARVAKCVADDRIAPGDIAVLVSRSDLRKAIVPNGSLGGQPVCTADKPHPDLVVVDTIRRFKGLERPVVLLVVDEEVVSTPELAYVALSRSRCHLILVGGSSHLAALTSKSTAR